MPFTYGGGGAGASPNKEDDWGDIEPNANKNYKSVQKSNYDKQMRNRSVKSHKTTQARALKSSSKANKSTRSTGAKSYAKSPLDDGRSEVSRMGIYDSLNTKRGFFRDVNSPTGWSYSNGQGGIHRGANAPTGSEIKLGGSVTVPRKGVFEGRGPVQGHPALSFAQGLVDFIGKGNPIIPTQTEGRPIMTGGSTWA